LEIPSEPCPKNVSGPKETLNINEEDLKYSNSAYHNENGSRPYQDSTLTMQEIIDSSPPSVDPQGGTGLYWEVEGGFMKNKGVNVAG